MFVFFIKKYFHVTFFLMGLINPAKRQTKQRRKAKLVGVLKKPQNIFKNQHNLLTNKFIVMGCKN